MPLTCPTCSNTYPDLDGDAACPLCAEDSDAGQTAFADWLSDAA